MPERIESATIVSMRRDRKGFKLEDDSWYSSFNAISNVSQGDVVSFDYAKKGAFNNIKGAVTVVGGTASAPATASSKPSGGGNKWKGGFPVPVDDMGRAINRQSAVAQAVNAMGHLHTTTNLTKLSNEDYADQVIDIARRLEAYTTGDLDTEIGKALAAEAEAEAEAQADS